METDIDNLTMCLSDLKYLRGYAITRMITENKVTILTHRLNVCCLAKRQYMACTRLVAGYIGMIGEVYTLPVSAVTSNVTCRPIGLYMM